MRLSSILQLLFQTAAAFRSPGALVSLGGTATLSLDTTHPNTWTGTQTFSTLPVLSTLSGLIAGNTGSLYQTATTTITTSGPLSFSSNPCCPRFRSIHALARDCGSGEWRYRVGKSLYECHSPRQWNRRNRDNVARDKRPGARARERRSDVASNNDTRNDFWNPPCIIRGHLA